MSRVPGISQLSLPVKRSPQAPVCQHQVDRREISSLSKIAAGCGIEQHRHASRAGVSSALHRREITACSTSKNRYPHSDVKNHGHGLRRASSAPALRRQGPFLKTEPQLPCIAQKCGGGRKSSSAYLLQARRVFEQAQGASLNGRMMDGVQILVHWLEVCEKTGKFFEPPSHAKGNAESDDLFRVQQKILSFCCCLCNELAAGHIKKCEVENAWICTWMCEKWLSFNKGPDDENWLGVRFDCAFNAAELAMTKNDVECAVQHLRMCESLQENMANPHCVESIHICLAEALLRSGQFDEASASARTAVKLARRTTQDERKRYAVIFALTLEQAALSSSFAQNGNQLVLDRALGCLPEAESVVFVWASEQATPVDEATQSLLEQMRRFHYDLLHRRCEFDGIPFSTKSEYYI